MTAPLTLKGATFVGNTLVATTLAGRGLGVSCNFEGCSMASRGFDDRTMRSGSLASSGRAGDDAEVPA